MLLFRAPAAQRAPDRALQSANIHMKHQDASCAERNVYDIWISLNRVLFVFELWIELNLVPRLQIPAKGFVVF